MPSQDEKLFLNGLVLNCPGQKEKTISHRPSVHWVCQSTRKTISQQPSILGVPNHKEKLSLNNLPFTWCAKPHGKTIFQRHSTHVKNQITRKSDFSLAFGSLGVPNYRETNYFSTSQARRPTRGARRWICVGMLPFFSGGLLFLLEC